MAASGARLIPMAFAGFGGAAVFQNSEKALEYVGELLLLVLGRRHEDPGVPPAPAPRPYQHVGHVREGLRPELPPSRGASGPFPQPPHCLLRPQRGNEGAVDLLRIRNL